MNFDPFRNTWAALTLAGLVVLAAAALVGSEESGGLLDFAAERPTSGGRDVAERMEPREEAPPAELPSQASHIGEPAEIGMFTPDVELVDAAEGFDTTPMIVHGGPGEDGIMLEAEGETLILPGDDRGPGS